MAQNVFWMVVYDGVFRDKTSHRRYSIEKAVLKNFAILTAKHLYWSHFLTYIYIYIYINNTYNLFLNKVAILKPINFIKTRLQIFEIAKLQNF